MLRLAQALARLRFATAVLHADVDEALRLMEASKESLRDEDDREGDGDADRSDTSRIYRIVKDMAQAGVAASTGGRRATRRRSQRLGRGPDRERDYAEDGDEGEEEGSLDVLSMVDIRARVLRAGYTETQLMTTIQEVCRLDFLSMLVVMGVLKTICL